MKLSQITIDHKLMMRVGVDYEIVDEYAQKMLDGVKFPPVIIFNDGDHNYLVEGFKRYYANKKNGFEIIDADVRMGTYDDAFDYAFVKANRDHGERYKTEDKRLQLNLAFEVPRYASKSDRELSRILDVSHTFVSKARKAVGKQPDVIETTRKGKPVKVKSIKKELEDALAPDIEEQDKIEEIATEMQGVIRENEELQNRLAVAALEATDEEKQLAKNLLEDKDEKIRLLEADNRVLKASRDSFQQEASELKKQIRYWENRAKKAEALLNKQAA
jgi:hypothetical protein